MQAGYSSQPFDLYNTHEHLQQLADQRLAGQQERRLVLVDRPQPHRQPGPAADLHHRHRGLGRARRGRRAGDGLRAGPEHAPTSPGTSWAPAPSTTRCRTMPRSSWPTTSRPPCVPATRWAGGRTRSEGRPESYLRNARRPAGLQRRRQHRRAAATTWRPPPFALTNDSQTHYMHGLSVKSQNRGAWDWEVAASLYDYAKDQQRAPAVALPLAGPAAPAPAGPGRHRLEHPGGQGHLAPAGHGRRAHRRLRHRPRCVQAPHPQEQRGRQLAGRPGRQPGERSRRPHARP